MSKEIFQALSEQDLLALTIWAEARGESMEGKIAVGWVIRNRVESDLGHDSKPDWWGEGYNGVILKPWQFSCFNDNDPNLTKLIAMAETGGCTDESCREAARQVMAGEVADPTGGATYYANLAVCDPDWASTKSKTAHIGRHTFFRD